LNEGPDAVVDRWIALQRVPVEVGRRSELDPRSYTEVRAGADVLWRGAWFEAALPDWM
jgi:hypothetical protein